MPEDAPKPKRPSRNLGCLGLAALLGVMIVVFPFWYMEAPLMSGEVRDALAQKPTGIEELRSQLRWQEWPMPLLPSHLRSLDKPYASGTTSVAGFATRETRGKAGWQDQVTWVTQNAKWEDVTKVWAISGYTDSGWAHNLFAGYTRTYWVFTDQNDAVLGWLKD